MPSDNAWDSSRPIYDRLPRQGYGDNTPSDWVTAWADEELSKVADRAQEFYKQVDPVTADSKSLDFLAWLVGMSGEYWDTTWTDPVKRQMISLAYSLWKIRGTEASIRAVLEIHGMDHDIWQKSDLRLSFKFPGVFGKPDLRFIVRLPLKYHRAGKEFTEAQRTIRNFAPAVIEAKVAYKGFYLSFSRLGDPLFKK